MSESQGQADPVRPLLRVVRGKPSAEELAALVAVVAAHAGSHPGPAPAPVSGWRRRPTTGPGAWRLSGLVKGTRTRASW